MREPKEAVRAIRHHAHPELATAVRRRDALSRIGSMRACTEPPRAAALRMRVAIERGWGIISTYMEASWQAMLPATAPHWPVCA